MRICDQTSHHNDLTIAPGGGANPTGDQGANTAALPITAGGHQVYGVYISAGNGYRTNAEHRLDPLGEVAMNDETVHCGAVEAPGLGRPSPVVRRS